MEIRATSKYDWKTIKAYNNFHNFKRNGFRKAMPIILIIAVAVSLLSYTVAVIGDFFDGQMLTYLILEVVAIGVIVFSWFILPKIMFNKNKAVKNSVNHFVFWENSFQVSGEGNGFKGSSEMTYSKVYIICETSEYIYIYINPRQAFIVEKAQIEGGKENELRHLLATAVGDKKYQFKLNCK